MRCGEHPNESPSIHFIPSVWFLHHLDARPEIERNVRRTLAIGTGAATSSTPAAANATPSTSSASTPTTTDATTTSSFTPTFAATFCRCWSLKGICREPDSDGCAGTRFDRIRMC